MSASSDPQNHSGHKVSLNRIFVFKAYPSTFFETQVVSPPLELLPVILHGNTKLSFDQATLFAAVDQLQNKQV
jgi:hypothetical protein